MPSYNPSSTKGVALEVTLGLITKGAVELAPLPYPGFYSSLFMVWKTSGSWRPVIDLSALNRFVDVSHFQMETIQSVLLSIRPGDWMASIDLREAYLQVPVHPVSRPFLRFVSNGRVYQFKALCFGLSTAPQVFTRVMAPVSAILHSLGIRMRRYLDDWLVQSSSRESLLRMVLDLCRELGIVVNPEKSNLVPSQVIQYLGVIINTQSFLASPSPRIQTSINRQRISVLRLASRQCLAVSAGDAFLHGSPGSRGQAALAVSPTLSPTVLGSVKPVDTCGLVPRLPSGSAVVASPASSLTRSISPPGVSRPRLLVRRLGHRVGCTSGFPRRFRPLGRGRGTSLYQCQGAAGHPSRSPPLPVVSFGEDYRSLLRQRHCGGVPSQGGRNQVSLPQFHRSGDPALVGVARHPSGSVIHPGLQQRPSGRSVSFSSASTFRVVPQHDSLSVFVSSVASPNRFVCHLSKSPLFDVFLSLPRPSVSGHGRLPPVLGRSSGVCFSSICHHSQSSCQTPGVSGDGAHASGSALASAALVSGPPPAVAGPSCGPPRPPAPASVSSPLPGSPQAMASCLETLQRFTRAAGFSVEVAAQASLARRLSSRPNYQHKWAVYRSWCRSQGHSVSRPSLSKVADFLCWLWSARGLSVSSIKGYRSMLSAVFRFHLPSLPSDPVLHDLLRSFRLSSAERLLRPPAWDLSIVLRFLNSSAFEPLSQAPLRALSQKTLFLLALATAKRVGVLQALSSIVTLWV